MTAIYGMISFRGETGIIMIKEYMADSHIHTGLSPDSEVPIVDMCDRAVEIGLKTMTFTDHCEIDKHEGLLDYVDTCVSEYSTVRDKYREKTDVLIGIEIGQPMYDTALAEQIMSEWKFDFVLGSVHCAPGHPDFGFLDYTSKDMDPYIYLDPYFKALYDTAKWGKMDSLSHITYPLRYFIGMGGMDVDMTRYYDIIDEIYKTLISGGKSLEINASGLRQTIGKTMPDESYLTRYRELGGELITIGSDAHTAKDLALGVDTAYDIAKECGFKYVACYHNRKPVMIKL